MAAHADDCTYLVTYNGHGDAIGLAEIDPGTGVLITANRVTYSTWGTPTVTTHNGYANLGFRYLYVGRFDVQWDDFASAGLLYMHARHYHPEFGRFLHPDPAALETNLYAYAENSPVTKADPSGLCWRCHFLRLQDVLRPRVGWLRSYSRVTVYTSGYRYVILKLPKSTRYSTAIYNAQQACSGQEWGFGLVGLFISGAGFATSTVSLLAAPPTAGSSLVVTAIGWNLSLAGLAWSTAQVVDCATR